MTVGLAFFHGWGLGPHFWQALAAALPGHPHAFFDAGYTGAVQQPDYTLATHWVAVGHSLGWAHALQNPPTGGWLGMVSLSGFTRFCAQAPDDEGQAKRVVERMVRVFERSPGAVLQDFLTRCQLAALMPEGDQTLATDRLNQDLIRLIDIDVNPLLNALPSPVLALASQDDVIVSPALTASTFDQRHNTSLTWHANGGHALGYAHADWCAQQIQPFIQSLAHGQTTDR